MNTRLPVIGYRADGKQEFAQVLVHGRVFTPNPFEHHRSVFFFFVAIVRQNGFELWVFAGIYPLVVPVNGLKFFH